jgi:hydroxymethylbilane synthase
MPTEETPGVVVAALPPRGDARDAVVTRHGEKLGDLPRGARVATESPRRRAFLLSERPDLEVVGIRGNVDTRLSRLDEGRCEALVLALAGLERLGLAGRVGEALDPERMIPAVGQGALAVQARADDPVAAAIAFLDHLPTRRAVLAERAFLTRMGGGCRAPFAAHARLEDGELVARGAALEPEGRAVLRHSIRGPAADPVRLGRRLADEMLEQGAATLAREGDR